MIRQLDKYYRTILTPLGFRKQKHVFLRVTNDVFQSVEIERLRRSLKYETIRIIFSVLPLCLGIDAKRAWSGISLYELRRFEPTYNLEYDGWTYCKQPETENAVRCEIQRFTEEYLLPFLESADSCINALPELIKLEHTMNQNRLADLAALGSEDHGGPNAELNLLDSSKYYMALKIKDYAFALRCANAMLQGAKRVVSQAIENGRISGREVDVERLEKEIVWIIERKLDGFHLAENEARTREQLV